MSSKATATPTTADSAPGALPPSTKVASAGTTPIPASTNELDHSGSNYDKASGKRTRKVPPKKVENWDEDA